MDLSKSLSRRDQSLQLVNRDARPLTISDKLKGKSEDIDNLQDVIDVERDLKRY